MNDHQGVGFVVTENRIPLCWLATMAPMATVATSMALIRGELMPDQEVIFINFSSSLSLFEHNNCHYLSSASYCFMSLI